MFRAEPGAHATLSMRLSFSAVSVDQMSTGIARLAATLAEARARRRKKAA
jgi:DNA-binding transcriptional MocR family regulator